MCLNMLKNKKNDGKKKFAITGNWVYSIQHCNTRIGII